MIFANNETFRNIFWLLAQQFWIFYSFNPNILNLHFSWDEKSIKHSNGIKLHPNTFLEITGNVTKKFGIYPECPTIGIIKLCW
jgi:hypothetical protein